MKNNLFMIFLLWLFHPLPLVHGAVNLELWPLLQQMQQTEQSHLWISNQASTPANLQIRIFKWYQANQQNIYQDQDAIFTNTPLLGILGHEKKLIRFFNKAPMPNKEQAYRIVIDEIPQPMVTHQHDTPLFMRMRFIIPLFVDGKQLAKNKVPDEFGRANQPPNIVWRIIKKADGNYLTIINNDDIRAKIANLTLWDKTAQQNIWRTTGLLGYVLAHSEMCWKINKKWLSTHHYQLRLSFFSGEPQQIITPA